MMYYNQTNHKARHLKSKRKTIGIPRALFYHNDPFFWPKFFDGLGFETVLSPPTNIEILRAGSKISESEECLSFKVFNGHLNYLKGKTDYVFIPRIKSLRDNYSACPKFFAIPDLARSFFSGSKIIEPNIDYNQNSLRDVALAVGISLKIGIPTTLIAYHKAVAHKKAKERELIEEGVEKMQIEGTKKILVIGHAYNLQDNFINVNIFSRLEKLGVVPIEADQVQRGSDQKVFHWDSVNEIVGKVKELQKGTVSGAIQISAFPCGCDSISKDFIKAELKEKDIPFLFLTVDEHSGEAGFITRIEAFIDTI